MSPRARAERRQNRPLREVLDDLLGHAREIARRAKAMTPAELDYAQQRLEWLAGGGWRGGPGGGARPPQNTHKNTFLAAAPGRAPPPRRGAVSVPTARR